MSPSISFNFLYESLPLGKSYKCGTTKTLTPSIRCAASEITFSSSRFLGFRDWPRETTIVVVAVGRWVGAEIIRNGLPVKWSQPGLLCLGDTYIQHR